MTEQEWLSWNGDPGKLLPAVRGRASERKLRLFACACCRRIWDQLSDDRSRAAVVTAEAFADGNVSESVLVHAHAAAGEAYLAAANRAGIFSPEEHSAGAARYCATRTGIITFAAANCAASSLDERKVSEQRMQCDLFRDIFASPFREFRLPRLLWSGPAIRSLARTIYEERSFNRLPELAHLLEQSGCSDAHILDHCRSPMAHVRGCWVIDLLLEKS